MTVEVRHSLITCPEPDKTSATDRSVPIVTARIVEVEQSSHPFVRVESNNPDKNRITLRSNTTGEEFRIAKSKGLVLLAIQVGIRNRQSTEKILENLDPEEPSSQPTKRVLKATLRELLKEDRGSSISVIKTRKGKDYDSNYYYYYEDEERTARANDFVGWADDELHRIRFDPHTRKVTTATNGQRQVIDIPSTPVAIMLEYLLRQPHIYITKDILVKAIETSDPDIRDLNPYALKAMLSSALGKLFGEASDFIRSEKIEGNPVFTSQADVVEIVDEDGYVHDIKKPKPSKDEKPVFDPEVLFIDSNTEEALFTRQDAFVLAIAFGVEARALHRNEIINQKQAVSLMQTVKQGIDRKFFLQTHLATALNHIEALLDADNINELLADWSPYDARLQMAVQCIAAYDKADGRGTKEIPRGIDDLRYIFRRYLQKEGDIRPGEEVLL